MSDFNKTFATQLKRFLNEYDMTQYELAEKMNISTATVSQWINGQKTPRAKRIDELCNVFHCKRQDLLSNSDQIISPEIAELTEKFAKLKSWQKKRVIAQIEEFEEQNAAEIDPSSQTFFDVLYNLPKLFNEMTDEERSKTLDAICKNEILPIDFKKK